jgi:hypothetical protein
MWGIGVFYSPLNLLSKPEIFRENGITEIINEFTPGKDGLYFIGPKV